MVKIPKERLNIQIPTRIKRRLKEVATDKELSMNDLINQAIKDYLDRVDFHHSAPDFVLDRLNQVLVGQMNISQRMTHLEQKVSDLHDNGRTGSAEY